MAAIGTHLRQGLPRGSQHFPARRRQFSNDSSVFLQETFSSVMRSTDEMWRVQWEWSYPAHCFINSLPEIKHDYHEHSANSPGISQRR